MTVDRDLPSDFTNLVRRITEVWTADPALNPNGAEWTRAGICPMTDGRLGPVRGETEPIGLDIVRHFETLIHETKLDVTYPGRSDCGPRPVQDRGEETDDWRERYNA